MTSYFFDTYALIEIVKGNPSYKKYAEAQGYTSLLNLYELYFLLLRDRGEAVAKMYSNLFKQIRLAVKDEHIFAASAFKVVHNKLGISYADALGYAMASAESMQFLTGDSEFKGRANVEFVK